MDLMPSTPKKTLEKIQEDSSLFVAKVKNNQKYLLTYIKEVEESSEINSHFSSHIKQSNNEIQRDVFIYSNFIFPWSGIFIHTVIRIDKQVNDGNIVTHYYISNDTGDGKYFLKKILQEWSVETMHFYKDCALEEDKCKVNKGAFALSVLRSIVINILHLHKVKNIARKIIDTTYDLAEALSLISMVRFKYGFFGDC